MLVDNNRQAEVVRGEAKVEQSLFKSPIVDYPKISEEVSSKRPSISGGDRIKKAKNK